MESLLLGVNWTAVVVGAVVAFGLGWLWYSPMLFSEKWMAGIGTPAVSGRGMMSGLLAQAVGTFLLAWVIGITATTDSLPLAILIAITIAVLIKANGLFGGRTTYAIMVESTFILAMVAVMVLAHMLL